MTEEIDRSIASSRPSGVAVREEVVDGVLVISVSDVVDVVTAPEFSAALDRALDSTPAALVVDLTAVNFLASVGMTVLVKAKERAGTSVRFAVVAAGPATARPLTLLGLDTELSMCTTLDEALRRVS